MFSCEAPKKNLALLHRCSTLGCCVAFRKKKWAMAEVGHDERERLSRLRRSLLVLFHPVGEPPWIFDSRSWPSCDANVYAIDRVQ